MSEGAWISVNYDLSRHQCTLPPDIPETIGAGSIWQCKTCQKEWTLVSVQIERDYHTGETTHHGIWHQHSTVPNAEFKELLNGQ